MRRDYTYRKMKPMQEVWFGDYEVPEEQFGCGTTYPQDIIGKTCGECVRCEKRDRTGETGYHCCGQPYVKDILPTDKACCSFWDRTEHERIERLKDEAQENRRKELWAIYAEREPIKLPIVHDGYGRIPECPICGEMPYSTEQCHWCGQRFIQDKDTEDYNKPDEEWKDCSSCGGKGTLHIVRSKYNGHPHAQCTKCGVRWMA